ncbi:MAG: S53 family peptidase [Verrucomicrobiia bacterium]
MKSECRRGCWWFLLLVGVVFGTPARAAGQQVLHGHVPAVVAQLQPVGRLPNTQRLNLAIGLPLRNKEELSALLQQLYDPASPDYRRYLTPAQFTERFGPTEQDYQTLIAFAEANGLTVTATHPNRVVLDVDGAVADVEKALHVTMRVYNHPKEARAFYAPDTEPSLGMAVPVLHINGLDNYSLPRPHLVATPLANAPNVSPGTGSGTNGSYMGYDFRAAYVPGASLTGSGQSVGLLQFDGYTASDIAYYEATNGLPSVTLTNVLLDGYDGTPTGNGGEVEVALDIEMVISMAPGLSKVILYEAGPDGNWYDVLNQMATDNLAKQLSCSWYIPGGAADPVADQIFQQMAAQGQSFFDASGDADAYTGLIDFPGDTPYITQVGGTTLTTAGPHSNRVSETVWNWGYHPSTGCGDQCYVGSGGGISTYYSIPGWQAIINMAASQGSATMRNTPDVALTADNVYVRADGGTNFIVGGTSCAAPLWAGFIALANEQAASRELPPVGFLNPTVYTIGNGSNYAACFHDITTGNNEWLDSPAKFAAVTGYDLCTGWGTPTGTNLINALAPLATKLTVARMQVKLNFAKPNSDSCTLTATLDPGAGFSVTNKPVTLDIGGAQVAFTLDAKGRGATPPNTCKLSHKKNTGLWTFTAALKKGSWATQWGTYGLTSAATARAGDFVTLPVILVIDGEEFYWNQSMLYKAKAGKSGTAK